MSRHRDARIASTVLGLRNPLARVELAASQLARSGPTPAARALAQGISEAVAELDRGIGISLRHLVPERSTAQVTDCGDVLAWLQQRTSQVIEARGVRFEVEPPSPRPLPANREDVRRAGLGLVRAGAALAGGRGHIALSIREDGDRWGLALQTTAGHVGDLPDEPEREEALGWLRDHALVCGLDPEIEADESSCRAVLWVGRGPS